MLFVKNFVIILSVELWAKLQAVFLQSVRIVGMALAEPFCLEYSIKMWKEE